MKIMDHVTKPCTLDKYAHRGRQAWMKNERGRVWQERRDWAGHVSD
jgi:hypothetical protein